MGHPSQWLHHVRRCTDNQRPAFPCRTEPKRIVCDALVDRPYRIRVTRVQYSMDLRDTPAIVVPAGSENTAVKIRVGPQDTATATKR